MCTTDLKHCHHWLCIYCAISPLHIQKYIHEYHLSSSILKSNFVSNLRFNECHLKNTFGFSNICLYPTKWICHTTFCVHSALQWRAFSIAFMKILYTSMQLLKNGQHTICILWWHKISNPEKSAHRSIQWMVNTSHRMCWVYVYVFRLFSIPWTTFVFENWFFVNLPLHIFWMCKRCWHTGNCMIESDVNCIIVQPKLLKQSWPISKLK